jgi:hypothetical protein
LAPILLTYTFPKTRLGRIVIFGRGVSEVALTRVGYESTAMSEGIASEQTVRVGDGWLLTRPVLQYPTALNTARYSLWQG